MGKQAVMIESGQHWLERGGAVILLLMGWYISQGSENQENLEGSVP